MGKVRIYYNIITRWIFEKKRQIWLRRIRSRLRNKDVTIISNNCCAGVIYKDLGIQFKSPTINLYFSQKDYLLFVMHLESYIGGALKDISATTDKNFPVGELRPCDAELPAIKVYFMHYKTFEEAYQSWKVRSKRINYQNLVVLWEIDNKTIDISLLKEFDSLPLKKMIFSYDKLPGIRNYFQFRFSNQFNPGEILNITKNGKRNIDEFDYVRFLNS